MALETPFTYINDLNPLNPAEGDQASDGDNHLRMIKSTLKATFPNITAAVTPTAVELNKLTGLTVSTSDLNTRGVPSGFIGMWSGSIASIPAGWFLCNGLNSTPNLVDRFVVGAGSTYAVSVTGGAATVTLTAAQIPAHTHTFSGTTSTNGSHTHTNTGTTNQLGGSTLVRHSAGTNDFNSTTAAAGDHNHTISGTTSSIGSSGSHENLPPYYALAYIMKA